MVKNPPANAVDVDSVPSLGRSHVLWGNEAYTPKLLSPRTTTEPIVQ